MTEQKQDEAIAFTRDGKSVLVGSEGVHSAVYRIALPAEAIAADVAVAAPTTRPTTKPVPASSALASLECPRPHRTAPASSAVGEYLARCDIGRVVARRSTSASRVLGSCGS